MTVHARWLSHKRVIIVVERSTLYNDDIDLVNEESRGMCQLETFGCIYNVMTITCESDIIDVYVTTVMAVTLDCWSSL